MNDPRIPLKHPWLAGLLAFLFPGAGHLYQGRFFKAAVYATCILGLFLTGMAMAEWKAVQPPPKGPRGSRVDVLKYGAQLAVGLPAMYGLVQRERYYRASNQPVTSIEAAFSAPFTGYAEFRSDEGVEEGELKGTIYLQPTEGPFGGNLIAGRLQGTFNDEPVELELGPNIELAKPIEANETRAVRAAIVDEEGTMVGGLIGGIPRPFMNWFECPMDDHQQQELHRALGKFHELAMVFTWIAGLLNVLAIWDAVEGPAYGYGDEEEPATSPDSGSPATAS